MFQKSFEANELESSSFVKQNLNWESLTGRNYHWYQQRGDGNSDPYPSGRTRRAWCATVCVLSTCVCEVCQGPTSRVVTGTIPATMFVYTEPLTHPNNQPLWAFLIPTQSQWSQVELATAAIRYSNTGSWSASHGLSFPHPLHPPPPHPPPCFPYCNSQRDTDLKFTGGVEKKNGAV